MRSSLFATRLLLALLLWFASCVLLWTPIPTPLDGLTLLACFALSAVLLDLAARYRARGVFALLTLAGIYGLLAALFIFPATALTDMPRTLFTRALGGHALMGVIALALFFGAGKPPLAWVIAAVTGAAWALWARWSPVEVWGAGEPTALFVLIGALVIGAGAIFAAALLARTRPSHASDPSNLSDVRPDVRLSPLGWLVIGGVAAALLLFQAAQGRVDGMTAVIVLTLAGFCAAILWFQKRAKGATLLESASALTPQRLGGLIGAFAFGGLIGGLLPRFEPDPIALLVGVFAAYGLIWLPAVSMVLGWRAFARQARAFKL